MEDRKEANSYDLVVDLLNQASLSRSSQEKVELLKQVQELIIHKEPTLLDNFFDEMLGFQSDLGLDVRKFVISFLEAACKVDGDILTKIIGNLNMLLIDENVNIRKKVILSMSTLYKTAIKWLMNAKITGEVMEETWKYLNQMRDHIVGLLDHDNDGIRTHSVKFCEGMILCLSPTTPDSEIKGEDQSLDIVTQEDGFLNKKKLEEDGKKIFKSLLDFLGSQTITSVNLMSSMTSMTHIAKKRPQFMQQTVEGFESLHVNLPPTLANSQVSSVRKSMKVQMLSLLKHPAASDMISQIATLLTDLGATQSEVSKSMPKASELAAHKRRKAEFEEKQKLQKKQEFKMPDLPVLSADVDDDEYAGETPAIGNMKLKDKGKTTPSITEKPFNPIDITTEDIVPKLDGENVADLVLLSMVMLPDEMPAHFQSTYTPIAAAGTPGQIKHISRLLAVQLTNAGLGRGVEMQRIRERQEKEKLAAEAPPTPAIYQEREEKNEKAQFVVPLSGTSLRRKGPFTLQSVTRPLTQHGSTNMVTRALQRMLDAEALMIKSGISNLYSKIVTGVCTQLGAIGREVLIRFIISDMKNRASLALSWIYQEYVEFQGFSMCPQSVRLSEFCYDESLSRLLSNILQKRDQPGASQLFTRLILEVPRIPRNVLQILKNYCSEENHMYIGMNTISELLLKRPNMQNECLSILLEFTHNDNQEVRNTAIKVIKLLYDHRGVKETVDKFCMDNLNYLNSPVPVISMFPSSNRVRNEILSAWTDTTVRLCLYMYLALTPDQPDMLTQLAEVYVSATSDVKRAILRLMEGPIKQIGMESQELMQFIQNCPKGSETLVTRIIHILTERETPTHELVDIVKVLYEERVTDVRFIIPVLAVLSKAEIYAALPKLIKLTPIVVKEVFNRLLGLGTNTVQEAALSPPELMVALHNIDPTTTELKSIIKATTMCFQERSIFTQEVLAMVIQQLMEQTPIPTLFMRTVIQSLAVYPKLLGFVLNVLSRLITKQVWKQTKVWEGFIKCCERTKPQSFQVLLQLPAPQLESVFQFAADIKIPLSNHVENFTPHQKAHIPKPILNMLEKPEPEIEEKMDTTEPSTGNQPDSTHVQQEDKLVESKTEPTTTDGAHQDEASQSTETESAEPSTSQPKEHLPHEITETVPQTQELQKSETQDLHVEAEESQMPETLTAPGDLGGSQITEPEISQVEESQVSGSSKSQDSGVSSANTLEAVESTGISADQTEIEEIAEIKSQTKELTQTEGQTKSYTEEAATEEAATEEAALEDAAPEEAAPEEAAPQGTAPEEAAPEEAAPVRAALKEPEDASPKETCPEETGHVEPGHEETGHEETAHEETGHEETGHEETGHEETGHQKTGPDEAGPDEAGPDEAGPDEATPKVDNLKEAAYEIETLKEAGAEQAVNIDQDTETTSPQTTPTKRQTRKRAAPATSPAPVRKSTRRKK